MKTYECFLCSSPLKFEANVVISPWIRALNVKRTRISKYMKCNTCSSGFFDYRYSNEEMNNIYRDYRGESYVNNRSKWEPWYSEKFNHAHDSLEFIKNRQESLISFLGKHLPIVPRTIVDIGGDRGQYIPDLGQSKSYIIESSMKQIVDGVTRLSSIHDYSHFDLVFYSHVLEHVSDPRNEIETLIKSSDYLYIEVPNGLPEISKTRKSFVRFIFKLIASLFPTLWKYHSKPSTGRGNLQGTLVKSEHINFFSITSFKHLADFLNVQAQIEVNSIQTPDRSKADVIQCLFGPRNVFN